MAIRLKSLVLIALICAALLGWTDSQTQMANEAEQKLRSGDSQSALLLLAKASEMKSSAMGEDRLGFLYAATGQNVEAMGHFQKSIQVSADYAPAHYHLGVILWLSKRPDEGLRQLQAAANLDPKTFDYRYRLGSAYIDVDANDKAVSELKAAVALDSTRPEAWQQLGVAEQRANNLLEAVGAYAKAAYLKPDDNSIRNGYAQLLIATRQPEQAIQESRKVLVSDPNDTQARTNIGYAYLKMGEFEKAEKIYREILELDSKSVAAHYNLGIALKMQDQLEAAQKEFQASIDLDPTLAESHYTLGITDWQLGDFPGTISEMKAALAVRSNYPEAHYMLGIALKQTGDLDAAITELKESIKLDPTTPGPFNTLGQILRIKGDKTGSEQAFAQGTKLKLDKDKQLANSLDQGMRGNMMPKPMTATK